MGINFIHETSVRKKKATQQWNTPSADNVQKKNSHCGRPQSRTPLRLSTFVTIRRIITLHLQNINVDIRLNYYSQKHIIYLLESFLVGLLVTKIQNVLLKINFDKTFNSAERMEPLCLFGSLRRCSRINLKYLDLEMIIFICSSSIHV